MLVELSVEVGYGRVGRVKNLDRDYRTDTLGVFLAQIRYTFGTATMGKSLDDALWGL